jgi:hypothetical protein
MLVSMFQTWMHSCLLPVVLVDVVVEAVFLPLVAGPNLPCNMLPAAVSRLVLQR